ncbi:MAG TPA: hypothetical protein VED47_00290 [Burkholderiaceae bacterium]|nr:hypothetical protein [Burkholderiaceae bacterium]
MRLQTNHVSSFEAVRALAIPCHALDLSGGELLFAGTHADRDEKTKNAYLEQFTSLLLRVAIALRTKFYQGYDDRSTLAYVAHCGSLFTLGEASEESVEFSMKDVCGKIIHAVTFEKYLEAQSERSPTTLSGKTQDGTGRELSLFVSEFAEAVWNWARGTETRRPEPIAVLPAPDVALTAIRPWTEIERDHRVGARLRAAVEGAAFSPQRLPAKPQRPAHHFGPCSIGND